ncbi:MAG: hypothetical protein RLP09_45180 [Sandaracinaceae bacterium]
MNEPDDVDLPDGLEALFDAGRREEASEAERAALRERLAPQLGGGGPGGGGAGGSAFGYGAVAAIGAAAVVLGLAVYLAGPTEVAPESSPPAVTQSAPTPDRIPERAPEAAGVVAESAVESSVDPSPRPEPPPPSAPTPSPASALSETDLIDRAQRALATSPRAALRWAGRHQRRYPEGALTQERELIAIEALSRSGSPAAARTRADAFLSRWPHSAHAPRVRSLVDR